jgi:hypothetical protein
MKKLLVAIAVLALVFSVSSSYAQPKMNLSIGGDVLLPMGDFGDAVSTGFGGSARFQYNVTPMFSAGVTAGYFTWSGKDITVGSQTSSGPGFKGLPIRVFGKYYFMPEGEKVRVYGMAELGLFFWSVDVPSFTILGVTYGGGTETGSDFNYAPGLGFELPLGSGSTMLDVSVRYDAIATEGSSSGNVGGRVGVTFPLGN